MCADWQMKEKRQNYRPEYAIKAELNSRENSHLRVTWKGVGLEVSQHNKEPSEKSYYNQEDWFKMLTTNKFANQQHDFSSNVSAPTARLSPGAQRLIAYSKKKEKKK